MVTEATPTEAFPDPEDDENDSEIPVLTEATPTEGIADDGEDEDGNQDTSEDHSDEWNGGNDSEDDNVDPQADCWASGPWEGQQSMDDWCVFNCGLGYCPRAHCVQG